jgi:hypothetical protein
MHGETIKKKLIYAVTYIAFITGLDIKRVCVLITDSSASYNLENKRG